MTTLLKITVAWCQFSLGTGISFLQDMDRDLPHFEAKWLKGIQLFLRHINGYLILDKDYVPPLQRENDQHIMDIVIDSKKFSARQIELINYCQLFLSVHKIFDISKVNGKWLHPELIKGQPTNQTPKNSQLKVIQAYLGPTLWKLWKRANLLRATKHGKLLRH